MFMAFILMSDRKESLNKTIRFPLHLVEQIEAAIVGMDVSFSGFVVQACRYALANLEKKDQRQESILLRFYDNRPETDHKF